MQDRKWGKVSFSIKTHVFHLLFEKITKSNIPMYMKYFFKKYINYTVKNKIVKRKRVFGPSRTFAECPRRTIWSDFQPTKCQRIHL